MTKQDILSKLTSRKFWAAVVGFVSAILTAANVPASSAAQVTAIIMAGATVIAYIVGEGLVDAAAASGDVLTLDSAEATADAPATTSTQETTTK